MIPFKTNLFENIPMNIPNNVDNVLKKMYGNNWEDICYSSTYNYENGNVVNKKYEINCGEILPDNIEDIFENVWIINLKRRPDRLNTSIFIMHWMHSLNTWLIILKIYLSQREV